MERLPRMAPQGYRISTMAEAAEPAEVFGSPPGGWTEAARLSPMAGVARYPTKAGGAGGATPPLSPPRTFPGPFLAGGGKNEQWPPPPPPPLWVQASNHPQSRPT